MKWRHRLRYPMDIRKAKRQLASGTRTTHSEYPAIGLDLYSDQLLFDCARHLTCLAASAHQIRSNLMLRCDRWMLAAIAHKKLGRQFLAMDHVTWLDSLAPFPDGTLVLMDELAERSSRDLAGQRTVSLLVGSDRIDGFPVMPYPMHPHQIRGLTADRKRQLRSIPKAGVFFAGNQKSRYGRDGMQNEFGVLPRLEILSLLREHFPDRIAPVDAGGRGDRIVLRDSATDPIAADQWMSVLAKHQFFLCCPGASQPVCHNVIEAMSVGCIPILEYADRLHPQIQDGINAICFQGRQGLVEAIARIDTLDAHRLTEMSQNAVDCYDNLLDGARFLATLRDNTSAIPTAAQPAAVVMPFHDHNLYSQDSVAKLRRVTATPVAA
ncbi:hypothetical protein NHH03_19255 [Stieleria sp. TO1_6]|uniref:hypothetical protein n=1 Tax=Stieleria tagensis TaxID=2956795 RepID=UPI00209A8A2B|nr:hypothetical protein [Stieleria tagensis]MCO8123892.1 hypothetical protein [Stieleria tagensis]